MAILEDGLNTLGNMDTSSDNMENTCEICFYLLQVSRNSLATSGQSGTSAQGWATYELFAEDFQVFLDPLKGGGEFAHGSSKDGVKSADCSLQVHEVGRGLARFGHGVALEAAGAGTASVASFCFAEPRLLDVARKIVLARWGQRKLRLGPGDVGDTHRHLSHVTGLRLSS